MAHNPTESTAARDALGDFAPKLVELTDCVLFDDIWSRTELSACLHCAFELRVSER